MTTWESGNAKTATIAGRAKPLAIALVVGLFGGPFISHLAGWQVTSSNAKAQVRAGIVEQQAMFCESRIRADVAQPAALDWSQRRALAEKAAIMPGATEAEWAVISACANRLGS